MRQYSADAACPKCRHDQIRSFYRPSMRYGHQSGCALECPYGEHMDRTCQRCEYIWAEACLAEANGALVADDERARRATDRLGIAPTGCDTGDWLAEEVLTTRCQLAEAEARAEDWHFGREEVQRMLTTEIGACEDLRRQLAEALGQVAAMLEALGEIGMRASEALVMHGVTGWDQPYDGTGDILLGIKDIVDCAPDAGTAHAERVGRMEEALLKYRHLVVMAGTPSDLAEWDAALLTTPPDAGKAHAHAERVALLEELVRLTARVGEWTSDRAPTNDELRRAVATMRAALGTPPDAAKGE